jgi:hypothetical protein
MYVISVCFLFGRCTVAHVVWIPSVATRPRQTKPMRNGQSFSRTATASAVESHMAPGAHKVGGTL